MPETSHLLRARWVFPVGELPIEDGIVEITDGRIVGLNSGSDAAATDLGDVAIIPGLVNAHTHLEFSHLTEPLGPAAPFADWIRAVVSQRRKDHSSAQSAIEQGIAEAVAAGTTCLGEIATSTASTESLDGSPVTCVAFWEVLGLDETAIERQQAAVSSHLSEFDSLIDTPCIRGLSPHAPYSVHPELFSWTIDQAVAAGAPVAMHLAETREELELLERGTGALVEVLRDFGLWREGLIPRGTTISQYLEQLSRVKNALIIHGNYLRDDEIAMLEAHPQSSVVYCPRTHRYFGHDEHPWRSLLQRGVNVALGTDSRASNPDLNLWNEVLFLRQSEPHVSGETLLRIATQYGAKALGLEDNTGTIAVGQRADLAIVALKGPHDGQSSYDRLMHPQSHVIRTMSRGQWIGDC